MYNQGQFLRILQTKFEVYEAMNSHNGNSCNPIRQLSINVLRHRASLKRNGWNILEVKHFHGEQENNNLQTFGFSKSFLLGLFGFFWRFSRIGRITDRRFGLCSCGDTARGACSRTIALTQTGWTFSTGNGTQAFPLSQLWSLALIQAGRHGLLPVLFLIIGFFFVVIVLNFVIVIRFRLFVLVAVVVGRW